MNTGTVTLGGPMVTGGGLVFTAAAMDNYLRAFDSDSGKQLWKYELPAGGQATPMTYTLKGKQYLVIAAGGHGKLGTKQGDYVLAFTLPQ
jgi:quinoprotein glucose dehydrogenase